MVPRSVSPNEFEIFFDDLNFGAQQRYLETFGVDAGNTPEGPLVSLEYFPSDNPFTDHVVTHDTLDEPGEYDDELEETLDDLF
jgi:hypothetical protein